MYPNPVLRSSLFCRDRKRKLKVSEWMTNAFHLSDDPESKATLRVPLSTKNSKHDISRDVAQRGSKQTRSAFAPLYSTVSV